MPDSMAILWYNGFSNERGFEDGGILRKVVLSQVASHIAIVRNQVSFNERNVCTVVTKKSSPLFGSGWFNTDMINVVKCNLTELTTKSASVAP